MVVYITARELRLNIGPTSDTLFNYRDESSAHIALAPNNRALFGYVTRHEMLNTKCSVH
jgi:hypothetical protein